MNLLLAARRKQQAQGALSKHAGLEHSFENQSNQAVAGSDISVLINIREVGQNLFDVKSPVSLASHTGSKRNLLLIMCGMTVILAAGASYYLHIVSVGNMPPPHQAAAAPGLQIMSYAVAAEPEKRKFFAIGAAVIHSPGSPQKPLLAAIAPPVGHEPLPMPATGENNPIRIDLQRAGLAEPLLDNAYLAYRNGNLDVAQYLYRDVLGRDARNTDALLGLAVIAQQRGEDMQASRYYSHVLALDPRHALANAGLFALAVDDGDENRLTALLDGQKDSSILHFALGNRYAEQSRWADAQQSYFNAYTLEPGNAGFAFNLAVSLDHLGQNELAMQYYQRALHLDQAGDGHEFDQKFDHVRAEQRVRELTR